MKTIALIASLTVALACACLAQAPSDTSPEKAAVIANDRAYEAAYAKADVKALADFFAETRTTPPTMAAPSAGARPIEGAIRAGLVANRGSKLAIAVDTVRVLGPETVLEKGSTTVTAKNGETSSALYTAIHMKKDGKWKISQLIESPVPDADAARPARGTRMADRRVGGDGQDERPDRPQPVSLGARRQFSDAAT